MLCDILTWVYASYAVHTDTKIHTGGAMSLGSILIHCRSPKHKFNIKSSTEAEFVGLSDCAPFNIFMQLFMESQGWSLRSNVLHQDIQNDFFIKRNGQDSCTINYLHIQIRYFFVKDRQYMGEFSIDYCPTWKCRPNI